MGEIEGSKKEGEGAGEEEESSSISRGGGYVVGYALGEKKVGSVIQPSLISSCAQVGIRLVPIDPTLPLLLLHHHVGGFDCIVHKIYGDDWYQNLTEFSSKHPNIPIVDPPHSILPLHNRSSMLQVLLHHPLLNSHYNTTTTTSSRFGVPRQVVVYDDHHDDINSNNNGVGDTLNNKKKKKKEDHGLNYPLIAKPLLANGIDESHNMALVYDPSGIIGLKTPIVLQEFVNHGGVIFKVYVAGRHIECVKRRSLPDISEDELKTLSGMLPFSQISNLTAPQYKNDNNEDQTVIDNTAMPPLDFVHDLANGMRERLGLNLFNFDMIREATDDNSYLVIDINYFPGYAKIPSYETMLTNFFLDIVTKDKEAMSP